RLAGFGLQRLAVKPFGVDRLLFNPSRRDAELRREMLATCGLDESATLLISVGRHHPEKRLGTVIAAVARANKTAPVGLWLLGDGAARAAVERAAASVPQVHVAGQIEDRVLLARRVASADALVHGCGSETFGLSIAEALCCGTPIIVPEAGGALDLAGLA